MHNPFAAFLFSQKVFSYYGCTLMDHQTCDELCKQDSYWYGHCASWDGRDFSCKCYDYKPPLDSTVCKPKQQSCNETCKKQACICLGILKSWEKKNKFCPLAVSAVSKAHKYSL
ncbi:unnamed protein product [Dracunculus medinensis]|uniref:Uncharacterized protein n=1 Tax=Dracunculus medinensis TaxID=318479 RepID=A0A3P7P9T9_DRAME|nr:unnamed protein product [Dracunculus medinensis]